MNVKNMAKPRIALIVDHPERDMAGLLLSAYDLCQQGATCFLVPYNLQEQEIFPLAPDFVLLNFVRQGNDGLARRMAAAGIRFGALDTEGGVWPSPEYYSLLIWKDPSIRQQASCLCVWGPKLAQHLVAEGFFAQDQIAVTGCPRFDLYQPMWRSLFSSNGSSNGRRSRKILVNTNYGFTNPRFATPEQNMKLYLERFGMGEERVRRLVEAEKQAIAMTIELVRKLAIDYPAEKILVRPHPFERPDCYQVEIRDLANVEVDASGPVQPQILRASVVIQRSCTTGIEAAIASVPTLSPSWIPAPNINPMAEAVSVPCMSYESMKSTLDSILGRRFQPPASVRRATEGVIDDWFYRMDGLSYKRVSETILRAIDAQQKVDKHLCVRYAHGIDGTKKGGWPLLSARARYLFGLSPDWSFRRMRAVPFYDWTKSKKHFEDSEVRQLIDRIHHAVVSNGQNARHVAVQRCRDRNDYSPSYHGYSLALTCDS